jgi:hypothetical protein
MALMLLPIPCILFSQFLIPDHKQIFSVVLLGSLCEAEGPRYQMVFFSSYDLIILSNSSTVISPHLEQR